MSDLATRLSNLSPAKRKLLEQRVKERTPNAEPIAIVGIGCRFPGAQNPDEFWQLIREGRCAVTEVPSTRWDADAFYDPTGEAPGKMSTRWGAFIDDVDQFDPQFFGISPREASRMDPQQRLLLEVAWESFEQAGIDPRSLAGSATGVFVGIGGTDYSKIPSHYENYYEQLDAHVGTGNALSIAANRLSYVFDFRGPSFAVDTACSSALVALHCAVRSLRASECDMALAGGVNLILSPEVTIAFSKARMLSTDGVCRPFDAEANGYVRGEGCGLVALKRLTDAVRDGDQVLAVVRSTAINQDGRTSGITAPNSDSQQQVIREALSQAGIESNQVGYIEAHGTGTPLGDPIETVALSNVFGRDDVTQPPCYMTSVKANIGHTETVSGVAGLIKTVLLLRHGVIPPQLNLDELNPKLSLHHSRVEIPTSPIPWPANSDRKRIAGVSSFGFGGTNAHVVLEETASDGPFEESTEIGRYIATVSAKSEVALKQQAERYAEFLRSESSDAAPFSAAPFSAAQFSAAANAGRTHFNHRLAITGDSDEEICQLLAQFAAGERGASFKSGQVNPSRRLNTVFLFTGQGSQYAGMGGELYRSQPLFREAVDECDELLADRLDESLRDILLGELGDDSLIHQTCFAQPAIFAIEYALAKLWMSWGVKPRAVIGHSVGEYAAACIAGVFSLEDGIRLIAERGRLMQQLPGDGKMAVIFEGVGKTQNRIRSMEARVSIAAINGPESTVVSGDADCVDEIIGQCERDGVSSQELNVSHAFHSPHMEPILEDFRAAAREVEYRRPTVKVISNLTGRFESDRLSDPDYWVDHIRATVRFSSGVESLLVDRPDVMLEVGPSPHLISMARRFVGAQPMLWLPSLRSGQCDQRVMLDSLSDFYIAGGDVDWASFHRGVDIHRVNLPSYPFQRSSFWFEPESPERSTGRGRGPLLHPLLGRGLPTVLEKRLFESALSAKSPRPLGDHVVQGSVVLPGAAYLEIALAAAGEHFGEGNHQVHDLAIQQAMFLTETENRLVQTSVSAEQFESCSLECFSATTEKQEVGDWTLHAKCRISRQIVADEECTTLCDEVRHVREVPVDSKTKSEFYQLLAQRELAYGDHFRVLGDSRRTMDSAVVDLDIPQAVRAELGLYHLHPAILDGCFQSAAQIVPLESDGNYSPFTYMPTRIGRLRKFSGLEDASHVYARRMTPEGDESSPELVTCQISILDSQDRVLVELSDVALTRVGRNSKQVDSDDVDRWIYETAWVGDASQDERSSLSVSGTWIVVGGHREMCPAICSRLEDAGANVIVPEQDDIASLDSSRWMQWFDQVPEGSQLSGIVYLSGNDSAEHLGGDGGLRASRSAVAGAMRMIQALAKREISGVSTWLITSDTQKVSSDDRCDGIAAAPLWGFGRVAALEHPELGIRMIDLGSACDTGDSQFDALAAQVVREFEHPGDESEIAIRNGETFYSRLRQHEPGSSVRPNGDSKLSVPAGPSRLLLNTSGSFDGLAISSMPRNSPSDGQVEIEVRATGLNFSDVLKAMGLYPGLTDSVVPLGIECSGIIRRIGPNVDRFEVGQEVIGVVPHGFATHALTHEFAVIQKPDSISFEQAATIPITFMTAHHALRHLADVQAGERVLIHAGAGGVGLAAIQVAQALGAEVYTTAGSDSKRDYLRELGVSRVMNSRTLDFANEVMQMTDGEGIDVVLNSLPGEAIDQSLSLLRSYGRFLEIGKTDIYQNKMVGLSPFQDNLSYFAIDLDRMLRQRPDSIRRLFADVMRGFADGTYRPLPLQAFTFAETRDAFRYMAQRKNIGKVVVSINAMKADQPDRSPKDEVGTYLITGGLGALGTRVAESLVDRGVRHVALIARREPNAEASETIERMRSAGANVAVLHADVTDRDSLQAAVDDMPSSFPPLRGLVHAAGVLRDGLLYDMEGDQLDAAMKPKVDGAWNVHRLIKDNPDAVLYLFSSVASILGSPGQANYAAGNSFLDALAHHRRARGLRTTSINWGPWSDSGMAVEQSRDKQLNSRGVMLLPPAASLDLMFRLGESDETQVTVMRADWPEVLAGYRGHIPSLLQEIEAAYQSVADGSGSVGGRDEAFRDDLINSGAGERISLLRDYFVDQLSVIMGLEGASIELDQPLNSIGLDSLMAIELKNQVETRIGVVLPMARFMDGPTVTSLAELVAELVTDETAATPVTPVEASSAGERYELSRGQQALWFLHKLAPRSAAYHICDAVRVRGPLKIDVLRDATQTIIDRHAAFRTTFHDDDGRPFQIIHDQWPIEIGDYDAVDWSEDQLHKEIGKELARPFDLESDSLMRVAVFRVSEHEHVLVFCVHHIVADFWSLVACTQEFMQAYTALRKDERVGLPSLTLDYNSFVAWQSRMLNTSEGEKHWEYWRQRLDGELPVLKLPTDRPRPPVQTYSGQLAFRWLDGSLTERLRDLAEQRGATLNMLLLAAYHTLLHRYSGQEDVVVGLPTSGRSRAEFAPLVGYFVNPVPVRGDLSNNPRFDDFVEQIRTRCLEALEHQDFPLSVIVDRLHPDRDPSRSTLFQAAFVMQKAQVMHEQGLTPFLMGQSGASLEFADLEFESMTLDQWVAQLDLSMAASEAEGGTSLGLQYNTDLFDESTAERFLDRFERMLRQVVESPSLRLSQIDLRTDRDRELLHRFNATGVKSGSTQLVHERIAEQCRKTPARIAVTCGRDRLTFAGLDRRANQLANLLRQRGAGPGERIGICLDREVDVVVAVQAILRTGAAYVPLDASYPAKRISQISQDAGMCLVLSRETHSTALGRFEGDVVLLDRDAAAIEEASTDPLGATVGSGDPVYVIFTSGSTGTPKGASVFHRGFSNLMDWYIDDLAVGQQDQVLVITSHGFDLTQKNLFATLMTGGTLHLSKATVYDPAQIRDEIDRNQITVINCTPSHMYGMADADEVELKKLSTLRLAVLGGEPIDISKLQDWQRCSWCDAEIVNSYGPTECTDVVVYHRLPASPALGPVPLGKPIRNASALILDRYLGEVPPGAVGELCLGGECVGGGYVNDEGLTASRFVELGEGESRRTVYRTGDLCRLRRDGLLEFVGRNDHQVKLRGFRIELGDIEQAIVAAGAIDRVVVIVSEAAPDVRQLVAYVVPKEPGGVDELREALRETLPAHMVPSSIVEVSEIPMSPHGKLDRSALPKPTDRGERNEYIPPSTEAEKDLARQWRELLHRDRVAADDNFFELGGDSLLSVELVSRLGRAGWMCAPATVFQHQVLSDLAAVLRRAPQQDSANEITSGEIDLTPIQRWFFELDQSGRSCFNQSVTLEVPSGLRPEWMEESVRVLIDHHDVLRASFEQDSDREWRQTISSRMDDVPFERIDLSGFSEEGRQARIVSRSRDVQRSLDLSSPPVFRVVYFDAGDEGGSRLLLTAHHLIVDPYSLRVILHDLMSCYRQIAAGQDLSLGPKSASLGRWVKTLRDLACSEAVQDERTTWMSIVSGGHHRFESDFMDGDNLYGSAECIEMEFSQVETREFQDLALRGQHVSLALLSTGLALANARDGRASTLVDVERLGRGLVPDCDLSRTVGWLVAMHPLALDAEQREHSGAVLERVRQRLSSISLEGAGFGLLRYMSSDEDAAALTCCPDIRLNYLGRMESEVGIGAAEDLALGLVEAGNVQKRDSLRPHLLEIDARIRSGRLVVQWTYSSNRHRRDTIKRLAELFADAIRELLGGFDET